MSQAATTTAAASTPATATTTTTTTATTSATTTGTTTAAQPAANTGSLHQPVKHLRSQHIVRAGGLTVAFTVTGVADPLKPDLDHAATGNKLVGIFLTAVTQGHSQPTDQAGAILTATNGKTYPMRLISDGDCGGGTFVPAGMLNAAKPTNGCIGYEIPRGTKPKALTISVAQEVPTKKKKAAVLGTGTATVTLG